MPLIPFPNVPDAPGVPQIRRSSAFPPIVTGALALIQGAIWRSLQVSTQWGVYDSNGKALGNPSAFTGLIAGAIESAGLGSTLSTGAVDYAKETRVADFPIERGSFASYNKVETPAEPTVTLCMSGNEGDRRAFLSAIDAACKSTDLFTVLTPTVVYNNYSITSYNYSRRADRGLTLLVVELRLKEVRQVTALYTTVNTQIDTPKNVTATPPKNNGKVQPKTPRTSIAKRISKKLGL